MTSGTPTCDVQSDQGTNSEWAGDRLDVRDLSVALSHSHADIVSEISFAVSSGQVLGLVGESGSGKTTIGLALLGYTRRGARIRSGSVLLNGRDIVSLSPGELRQVRGAKIAYVPQDPSSALNPALRVGRQLEEVLKVHPEAVQGGADRIDQVLGEVRLDEKRELLRRYPHQLSGGEQQRIALAMAFLCRPSLIVLDEPTTGLDVTTQRHVLDTIRNLCRAYGVAAVYVSHDLAVVSGLVTNVAVLYAGRIVELGSTDQVFARPAHPYTRGLLAAVPSSERAETLVGIEGQPPRPGRRPPGCSFANRCDLATDQCRAEMPPATQFAGRLVRCFHAEESSKRQRETIALSGRLPHEETSSLVVSQLAASYGEVQVLDDISFEVAPEQCVAVIGESGSGKTTLARCIVGMHRQWTGSVTYHGEQLAKGTRRRPKETLRRIQYIFQNPYTSLNPRKTIGQILSQPLEHFFGLSLAERSKRVDQVLEETLLSPEFVTRYPDELSGGERQRVAIARALVVNPDLLVCDEVTSALDVSVQAGIVELLRRLQRERRLAMIFVTHNLALVRSIAQTAVVFREGRIVDAGSVEDMFHRPGDEYTIRLMDDVPKLVRAPGGQSRSAPVKEELK